MEADAGNPRRPRRLAGRRVRRCSTERQAVARSSTRKSSSAWRARSNCTTPTSSRSGAALPQRHAERTLPRWTKIIEERDRLRDEGAWDAAVVQSEQQREFQQSIVKGEVESADASPALSRAVATALSPVLKAAANTSNKADGGQLLELNKLQETAGPMPQNGGSRRRCSRV